MKVTPRVARQLTMKPLASLFQPLKNSTNAGACAFAFTLCVCPSSVRYCALGRAPASDSIPWRIHTGLFPPSITSVGIVTKAQWLAGSGLPL